MELNAHHRQIRRDFKESLPDILNGTDWSLQPGWALWPLRRLAHEVAYFHKISVDGMLTPAHRGHSVESRARRIFCARAHDELGKSWEQIALFIKRDRSCAKRTGMRGRKLLS